MHCLDRYLNKDDVFEAAMALQYCCMDNSRHVIHHLLHAAQPTAMGIARPRLISVAGCLNFLVSCMRKLQLAAALHLCLVHYLA